MHRAGPGRPLHTRLLTVEVHAPVEGVVSVRGQILDLRKCGFAPVPDRIQGPGLIHDMRIEASVNSQSRRLEALSATQPTVAFEPSEESRGESCRDPAANLQQLVGETVDDDFARSLSRAFGGPRGCSHLLTLMQLVASTLPRALDLESRRASEGATRATHGPFFKRSLCVDGFELEGGDLQLVVQLDDLHSAPGGALESPLDRYLAQREVRVVATVEMDSMTLAQVVAAERARTREALAGQPWLDLTAQVKELAGLPAMAGLNRELLARFRDPPPELQLLRDALLHLAPAFVQVTAAILDRWFGGTHEFTSPESGVGGFPDSCYMWRHDGALLQIRNGPGE